MAETLQAHASVICLQHPFLPTARLNKRGLKSVHHHPLVSGRKSDTEETSKQKKPKQGTALEVTGAVDYNPVVSTDYTGRGL